MAVRPHTPRRMVRRTVSHNFAAFSPLDCATLSTSLDAKNLMCAPNPRHGRYFTSAALFRNHMSAKPRMLQRINTSNLVSLSEQQFVDCDTVESACDGVLMDNAFASANQNATSAARLPPLWRCAARLLLFWCTARLPLFLVRSTSSSFLVHSTSSSFFRCTARLPLFFWCTARLLLFFFLCTARLPLFFWCTARRPFFLCTARRPLFFCAQHVFSSFFFGAQHVFFFFLVHSTSSSLCFDFISFFFWAQCISSPFFW